MTAQHVEPVPKKQCSRPGPVALHEICQYQKTMTFLIAKCRFNVWPVNWRRITRRMFGSSPQLSWRSKRQLRLCVHQQACDIFCGFWSPDNLLGCQWGSRIYEYIDPELEVSRSRCGSRRARATHVAGKCCCSGTHIYSWRGCDGILLSKKRSRSEFVEVSSILSRGERITGPPDG
ncbi:hypothetical protein B0H14DRAFT_2804575 [Mycena olivaceomarginata]|nr:hypothetical protein B0H14DRAFT_2804575 [Mycena olivaceomarginata]